MARWLGCLPRETSILGLPQPGEDQADVPSEQPNEQDSCGRGRNSELAVDGGSWWNKLYITQRARKRATRGSVTAAQWLQ